MKFSLAFISLLLTPVAITARVGVPQELDGRHLGLLDPPAAEVSYGITGTDPDPATIEWKTYATDCANDNPIDTATATSVDACAIANKWATATSSNDAYASGGVIATSTASSGFDATAAANSSLTGTSTATSTSAWTATSFAGAGITATATSTGAKEALSTATRAVTSKATATSSGISKAIAEATDAATAEATATVTLAATATATATAATTTSVTAVATATATGTAAATATATATVTALATKTVCATVTATATSSGTGVSKTNTESLCITDGTEYTLADDSIVVVTGGTDTDGDGVFIGATTLTVKLTVTV